MLLTVAQETPPWFYCNRGGTRGQGRDLTYARPPCWRKDGHSYFRMKMELKPFTGLIFTRHMTKAGGPVGSGPRPDKYPPLQGDCCWIPYPINGLLIVAQETYRRVPCRGGPAYSMQCLRVTLRRRAGQCPAPTRRPLLESVPTNGLGSVGKESHPWVSCRGGTLARPPCWRTFNQGYPGLTLQAYMNTPS